MTRDSTECDTVTVAGIWVNDAKGYKGRPELQVQGGIVRARVEKLLVGRPDCTRLVDGVLKQVELVRQVSGDLPISGSSALSTLTGR